MEFVQKFTPLDFQVKNFTPSILPNFNSFNKKKKNTKNEWIWKNLHRWQKFYTAAGTDGMDKFHLCMVQEQEAWEHMIMCANFAELMNSPFEMYSAKITSK